MFAGVLPAQHVVALPRDEESTAALDRLLSEKHYEVAAIIVEPLVQGAGGMMFHDGETLRRLRALADKYDLLLIFDEIFTGFGRTGALFAMESASVTPDIVTLSKALTGGVLPLSAAIAGKRVFDAFWSEYPERALMHGPTYMANPLACAAANASLDLFETGAWKTDVPRIERGLRKGLAPCAHMAGVRDVRVMGAIGVVELEREPDRAALTARFVAHGAWIRPLGRVVYLTPALNIVDDDLGVLTSAIVKALSAPTR
jgi:adenosylmethionine-8-amino-7-oxononanoate aminotransferase